MPYAMPSPSSPDDHRIDLPPLKLRPKHRRTRSSVPSFSDEQGPGAFASLPHLPRRKSVGDKKPLFHFSNDQDSDSSDEPPPTMNSLGLTVDTTNLPSNLPSNAPPQQAKSAPGSLNTSSLPFPSKLSPTPSPAPASPLSPSSASPLPRTPSTPIVFLANGKPLKPSLKSSHSSPHIPGIRHTRAQSEPCTPGGSHKNVHFPEKEALQSVRVFDKSGKPASVSKTGPLADETETETEYDSSNAASSSSYPFPSLPSASTTDMTVELHPVLSSPVPTANPSEYANVHLETLVLPRARPPVLRGSVLVRNLAFAKEVAVRFTVDDWQTTSEVTGKHITSLPSLPPPFREPSTPGDQAASIPDTWDRFSFLIRLEDFERKLSEKTLYLVVRYTVPGTGEWWDNNEGTNYRVAFQNAKEVTSSAASAADPVTNSQQRSFSAPSTLRGTPTTGAVQEQAQTQSSLQLSELSRDPHTLPKLTLPTPRAHFGSAVVRPSPPIRSNSSPQPAASYKNFAFSAGATRVSLPSKLNLLNYAAPTPMSPPMTPPQSRLASLSSATGMLPMTDEAAPAPAAPLQMGAIIGGMPATAPPPSFTWSSPPDSASSPPPSYFSQLHAPAQGEDADAQTPKAGVASPTALASDSSYAAFVKQWCFVQSPTPSPTPLATPRVHQHQQSQQQPQENAWLGMEPLGLYGARSSFGTMRSDSPMLASM